MQSCKLTKTLAILGLLNIEYVGSSLCFEQEIPFQNVDFAIDIELSCYYYGSHY